MALFNTLAQLEAKAATPDERVFVEILGKTGVRVSFAPGYYEQASDVELERQFTRLAKLAFVERMRAYYRIRSEAFGREVTRESPPAGERDERFVDERSKLVATGTGAGGRIAVSVVGMTHWTVRVSPGTHRALSEADFCRGMAEAGQSLLTDQFSQIRKLKHEIYD